MFWKIEARIERTVDGWTRVVGVPTFYLCAPVQGIVDANHAARVGASVVSKGMTTTATLHVTAYNPVTDELASLTLGAPAEETVV